MALVALLSISLILFSLSIQTTTLTQAHCLPDQRHALIQLKQGFNTTQLNSWNPATDCCIWDGIECDEKTDMVTAINLADKHISGELDQALFSLSSLQYLNLAGNQFNNLILPQTGFERLANLTHLDLSNSGFVGQVPIGICALTKLISLNLSDIYNKNTNTMYIHDLQTLLSNLTKLQVLRLDGIDMSPHVSEWGNTIFHLPNLQKLSMSDCGLRGNFPNEIFHLTNLTELVLSDNPMLSGKLPEFTKQSFLQYLYLRNCNFSGEIPPSIKNLTRLEYLEMSSNRLTGTIPMSLFSHPCLISLHLSKNQLSGYLPELSNGSSILESIYLSNNNLEGQLPISIFKSPQLIQLNLESNNFNGTFNLDNIQHNSNLESLDLSSNNLSIIEGKTHKESFYSSFPQMRDIRMASCNLTKFPSFLRYQSNVLYLDLSNNNLMGGIPLFICNATIPRMLDLSYNNLAGTIPACLLENGELEVLNLRSNKLSGPLSQNISQGCKFITIDLSGNGINGSLPRSLINCNTLEILDLGNNQIADKFPFWLGNLKNLRVLVLRSNQFYGTISNMEDKYGTNTDNSFFLTLKVFDLSSNSFNGFIPIKLIENLKAMLTNSDSSIFVFDGSSYYQNSITVTWKGQELEMKNSILSLFSSLDLSQNGFSGEIPDEIGQLNALLGLNLSHNALTGPIPLELGNLQQLESLDLSYNQLSGPIPQELTSLNYLLRLNLAYNHLVGEISQANQFSSFGNDSYFGNPGLCGRPLSMQCLAARSNPGLASKFSSGGKTRPRHLIMIITVSVSLLIIGCFLSFLLIRKLRYIEPDISQEENMLGTSNKTMDQLIRERSSDFPLFDFNQIANATGNFSLDNKLGEGGFGPVYKGVLQDGLEIAVKRLSSNSGQGQVEFKNEIQLIAKLQHRNLVRLVGWCIQGLEKILIYEFMPNKSLDYFILDKTRGALLNWERRFEIIKGIAQGLLYLHQHSRLRIVHRDLKASNILLDSEMNPKISDFGLARIFGPKELQANTNRVVGTYGYMAPEYASEGLFSIKSDVFSFGVLLMEIVSGKRNTGFHENGEFLNLLGYAWHRWKGGNIPELICQTLTEVSQRQTERCIHVGLLCVQENPADRPIMSDVIMFLTTESILPEPKHPAYFNMRVTEEAVNPSINYVTLSNPDVR